MKTPSIIIEYANHSPAMQTDLDRHIENLVAYFGPELVIEVMAYGDGIRLVMKMSDEVSSEVSTSSQVRYFACHHTMERMHIEQDELLNGVTIVPSGLGRIVDRQLAGWPHLRA